jgi:predicted methyltransferase
MNRTVVALASLTIAIGGAAAAAESAETAVEEAVGNARRSDADRARDKTSKPAAVLEFFGIEPGMHVLDLISGGGYYTEILSGAVGPDGEVVAHTNDIIEKYSKKDLAERYRGNRLPNVKRLISNPPDLKLPREAFDLVLMIMVYHDIYYVSESNPNHPKIDRDLFLAQIRRSLKPGGILAIVDHAAMPGTGRGAAQELHRIDEEFAKRDIEAAGFVFDGESSVLRNPGDDKTMLVFDERVRRRTDRFVYRFVKSGAPDWDASSFYRALGFSLVESDPHATHELSLRPNALHRS